MTVPPIGPPEGEIKDKNKRSMFAFIKKHKDELCLFDWEVVRVVSFAEDTEDYYYRCQTMSRDALTGWVRISGCLELVPLKGRLRTSDYKELDEHFKTNWNMYYSHNE